VDPQRLQDIPAARRDARTGDQTGQDRVAGGQIRRNSP
jgi:hypothetical protein